MTGPLRHVTPGQSLSIPASDWNTLMDLAQLYRAGRISVSGATPGSRPLVPCTRVLVSNGIGSSLPIYSVVKLGTPIISTANEPGEAARTPAFTGETPTGATNAFAVLLEPLPGGSSGSVVYAATSGVTVAWVSVTDLSHTHAAPANGVTASLASATSGPARLLATPTSTGVQKILVQITGVTSGSGATGTGTDDHITRWDGTTAIQDSAWEILDGGRMSLVDPDVDATNQLSPGFEILSQTTTVGIAGGIPMRGYGMAVVPDNTGGVCEAVSFHFYLSGAGGPKYSQFIAGTDAGGNSQFGFVGASVYAEDGYAVSGFSGQTGTLGLSAQCVGGIITNLGSGSVSGTNTGDQLVFKTIAVSGQSDVVADTTTDTLTLVAGSNVTITTNAGADSITISAAGGGTVTSVALTVPGGLTVSGSPVTTSGTLAVSLTTGAGVLKTDGTNISTAAPGVDYASPSHTHTSADIVGGFTGTGVYTNFTIVNGIVVNAF